MSDEPILPRLAPMEARLVDELPDGGDWRFEPKWDGFRLIVYREGERVELLSKAGKPLGRFFPEVEAWARALPLDRLVIDGELVIERDGALSFDALQARLHPAASRIAKLSRETPARLIAFDLLWAGDTDWSARPLAERRAGLERLDLALSPQTEDRERALGWLAASGGALDGVVTKRADQPYQPGERGFLKVKQHRTADCVVGGFRYASGERTVASLLLGLYDVDGRLDHVGFTSALAAEHRAALTTRLEALEEAPGFTGATPGGQSRWRTERSDDWHPLRPELVVEVRYDQVTAGRFRHGTRLLRWRPDKRPDQCTREQLSPPLAVATLARL